MADARDLGTFSQGVDEQIAYSITTTNWGSSPSAVAVVAKCGGEIVSGTVLSGTASVSGDVITLPVLKSLTAGKQYRIEAQFTANGNVFEAYFRINATE